MRSDPRVHRWGIRRAMRAGLRVLGRTFWGGVFVQAVLWGPILGLLIFSKWSVSLDDQVWSLIGEEAGFAIGLVLLGFLAITTASITRWMSVRLRDPGARTNLTFRVTLRGAWSVFLLQLVTLPVAMYGPYLLLGPHAPWGALVPDRWIVPVSLGVGIVLTLVLQSLCFLATPAVVVEGLGPWRAMRRSVELGQGHRADLFGLTCALLLVVWVALALGGAASSHLGRPWFPLFAGLFVAAFLQLYLVACRVAAYYDLRANTEGEDPERIAAIFD